MLAMADQNGRVWGSIPGLANRARVPVDDARLAIDTFLGPDPDSRTSDFEGRRIEAIDGGWRLLNHEKYRAIRDEESIKEAKRKYINARRQNERDKKLAAANVDQGVDNLDRESIAVPLCRHNAEADTDTDKDKEKRNTPQAAPVPPKRTKQAKEPKETPAMSIADLAAEGVDPKVAADWMHIRKAKKSPLTITAWEAVKREAILAGMTVAQAVKHSTENGWQGFKAAWLKSDRRSNPPADMYEGNAL